MNKKQDENNIKNLDVRLKKIENRKGIGKIEVFIILLMLSLMGIGIYQIIQWLIGG